VGAGDDIGGDDMGAAGGGAVLASDLLALAIGSGSRAAGDTCFGRAWARFT
jgi:hypothetical protein